LRLQNQAPKCPACGKHHFPVTNIEDATPEYVRAHIAEWEKRLINDNLKRKAESDISNGLLYTVVESEDESKWVFRCDSCRQTQDMLDESVTRDTPFPHLPNCPMLKK